jgi:hypothetical protein
MSKKLKNALFKKIKSDIDFNNVTPYTYELIKKYNSMLDKNQFRIKLIGGKK